MIRFQNIYLEKIEKKNYNKKNNNIKNKREETELHLKRLKEKERN